MRLYILLLIVITNIQICADWAKSPTKSFREARYSLVNNQYIVNSTGDELIVSNIANGNLKSIHLTESSWYYTIFSTDDNNIAYLDNDTLKTWNIETGISDTYRIQGMPKLYNKIPIAYFNNQNKVVCRLRESYQTTTNSIIVVDLDKRVAIKTLNVKLINNDIIRSDENGNIYFYDYSSKYFKVLNIDTWESKNILKSEEYRLIQSFFVDPKGKYMAIISYDLNSDKTVYYAVVYDIETGKQISKQKISVNEPSFVADRSRIFSFTDNSQYIYVNTDNEICLNEIKDGKSRPIFSTYVDMAISDIYYSSDLHKIVYANAKDNNIFAFDINTQKSVSLNSAYLSSEELVYSDDGKYVYLLGKSSKYYGGEIINQYDASTGNLLMSKMIHNSDYDFHSKKLKAFGKYFSYIVENHLIIRDELGKWVNKMAVDDNLIEYAVSDDLNNLVVIEEKRLYLYTLTDDGYKLLRKQAFSKKLVNVDFDGNDTIVLLAYEDDFLIKSVFTISDFEFYFVKVGYYYENSSISRILDKKTITIDEYLTIHGEKKFTPDFDAIHSFCSTFSGNGKVFAHDISSEDNIYFNSHIKIWNTETNQTYRIDLQKMKNTAINGKVRTKTFDLALSPNGDRIVVATKHEGLLFGADIHFETGVEEDIFSNSFIKAYPNPVSNGTLSIDLDNPEEIQTVQMFNYMGELVASFPELRNTYSKNLQLHIGNYPSGAYVIRISCKDKVISKNIIVE